MFSLHNGTKDRKEKNIYNIQHFSNFEFGIETKQLYILFILSYIYTTYGHNSSNFNFKISVSLDNFSS